MSNSSESADSLVDEIVTLTKRVDELTRQKDGAYAERNRLVAVLTKLFPAYMGKHPADDADWDPEWTNIVFLNIPSGQCTWHVHDSEMWMFKHLEFVETAKWDGHTTAEKYERLARLL